MTKRPAPYTRRFNSANARAFAFRIEREIMTARENIYDLVREKAGLPLGDVSDLRVLADAGQLSPLAANMFKHADALYMAQRALLEAGKMLL